MMAIKQVFTFLPYGFFAVTMLTFVLTSGFGRRAKVLWTLVLAFCSSKFLCFRLFGGDTFYPEFPEIVIWFWNWAYSASIVLCGLSLVWWHRRSRGRLLPLLAALVSAWGLLSGLCLPNVREVEFAYSDLPEELDGYRIVQLSDIHASSAARRWRTERLVALANAADADLVCVTGDLVDGPVDRRRDDIAPLAQLRAKDGVYFVAGNHEFYFDWPAWKAEYRRLGLRFLANECVFPRKSLALGGVNDFAAWGMEGQALDVLPDVRQAFAAATNGEFRVLLQHQPKWARENAKEVGVRLQLSGHTHGGVMPGISWLVGRHNLGFVRDVHDLDGSFVYVHSGSGQWAGFPMRFFAPSEIAVIVLRKGSR